MKKLRRSMLFCPANNPKMLINANLFRPDCIIFDLEDSIALSEKDSARDLLSEALKVIDYGDSEIFARINPLYTEFAEKDVEELVKSGLKNIRLPMCESKSDIETLSDMLKYYENKYEIKEGSVKIQGAIETPKGVLNSLEIATASKRMVSISFGAEDYTNSLGINRSKNRDQLIFARSQIVLSANVAGIDAIDTVYSDLSDMENFIRETSEAKDLGFAGKSCIHPQQVKEAHKIFTPSEKEVEKALRIIKEAELAEEKGLGVISVDGKMVDKPVIEKALRIVQRAKGANMV